jgi:hypothetical protein
MLRAIIITLLIPTAAFALRGKLASWNDQGEISEHWKAENPTIVFAVGMLPPDYQDIYEEFAGHYERRLAENHQAVSFKVVKYAVASDVVQYLQDPNTVGFILISHTYQTEQLDTAVLVGAEGHSFPTELLSAATPSLRFAAMFGCYGPKLLRQYQVKYELARVKGQQTFFYTLDKKLSSGFLGMQGVMNALNKMIEKLPEIDFLGGTQPESNTASVSFGFSDVVSGIEPRFVYVNRRIVGVLGGTRLSVHEGDLPEVIANQDRDISFGIWSFPQNYLKKTGRNRLAVRSADLTPGAPADDYMIFRVQVLTDEQTHLNTVVGKHYGDNDQPWQGDPPQPRELSRAERKLVEKYWQSGWEVGTTPIEKKIREEYLQQLVLYNEWLDFDSENWQPLNKRFFSVKF